MSVKPKTNREMIELLWYHVVGSNGDGILAMMRELIKWKEEFMRHREQSCPVLPRLMLVDTAKEKAAGLRRERVRTFLAASGWVAALISILKLAGVF